MEADGDEISRLPEELLASILSRTSPPDAGRCAAVSRSFLAAADSDAVWSCFLPRDLPRFAEGVLPHAPPSKKGLFRYLSDQPALLPGKLVSMRLDRATGTKCYMLSARSLHISWGETIDYWEWIKLRSDEIQANNSFREAAQLQGVWWLLIRGEIHSTMLSPNSKYAAYMVFKLADEFIKLDFPFQEASITVGGNDDSTRQVCLQAYMEDGDDGVPRKHILRCSWEDYMPHTSCDAIPLTDDVMLPRKRVDGWMEVELGEFYNGESCDSDVSVCLKETEGGVWKTGLIVWGIEIRTKQ
ncbi:F-box protein PP2-B11-like [Triticum urartu]|uniref:F-box protein PP2-B11-like n=1 Tax=Triticum urartu TaxID=4572 RepID=UPI002042D366|nr:F-box protein PP2-B11-like [Triticum urartu]XP_048533987.1 F-box protein PP2-B11-like [Triticum urartu]